MGVRGLCWCLLVLVMVQVAESDFHGIPGVFCGDPGQRTCCKDRQDECSRDIRGTTCYCDMFCHNRTARHQVDNDCCPDFWDVCVKGPGEYRHPPRPVTTTERMQGDQPDVPVKSTFAGIPGHYCKGRQPRQCCKDRRDECGVPIRGTTCYCDMFCHNRTEHIDDDCCPDFEEVCLGGKGKPPPLPPAEVQAGTPPPADDPNQGDERKLNLISGFAGIPGSYCKNRKPSECCDDRWDDCKVPIQGTVCYCDEFCLKGPHDKLNDCCPDFVDVCRPGEYTRRRATRHLPREIPVRVQRRAISPLWGWQ